MKGNPSLLRAENLGRQIAGRWIWRGLSLDLRAGTRAVLVGPSGSGKTLLMRALVGLDAVDEGAVHVLDRPLADWDLPRARRSVLWLPRQPVVAPGPVWNSVRLALDLAVNGGIGSDDRERAIAILERLGRPATFLDQDTGTLSGGEEQILALMRAMLLEPRVLLADEPTAHIDGDTRRRVETLLREWIDDDGSPGRAWLWTSHDADQLGRVGDGTRIELDGTAMATAAATASTARTSSGAATPAPPAPDSATSDPAASDAAPTTEPPHP